MIKTSEYLKKYITVSTVILFIWVISHIFTLSWGLPNSRSFAEDCIVPKLTLNAFGQMLEDNFKYPPLQYLIVNLFLKKYEKEPKPFFPVRVEKQSERILRMRVVCAVMTLFTAEIIGLLCIMFFHSSLCAIFGATLFMLNPLSLFYSHTSNMEQPYLLWFMGAFGLLLWAERRYGEEKKIYYILHCLAGVFMALSFCTKDNVYPSLLIFPFILFFFQFGKKRKKILSGQLSYIKFVMPFIGQMCIWLGCFILTMILVYEIAGGYSVFKFHFDWITGNGVSGYQQVANTISGRMFLVIKSFKDLCMAMDYPLIFILIIGLYILFEAYKRPVTVFYTRIFLLSAIFLFTVVEFLFIQITRFSHPRYYLVVLPFLSLFGAGVWHLAGKISGNLKIGIARRIIYVFFIFQVCVAFQFLYLLKNNTKILLKEEFCKIRKQFPDVCVATTGLRMSVSYKYTGNKITKVKVFRHFDHTEFGDLVRRQISIILDPVCISLVSPNFIIVKDKFQNEMPDILQRNNYVMVKFIKERKAFFPSLYTKKFGNFIIFMHKSRRAVEDVEFKKIFKDMSLEQQMLYLQACIDPLQMDRQANLVKTFLHSFHVPQRNFLFFENVIFFIGYAYEQAGRLSDAREAFLYLRKIARSDVMKRNINIFFAKHPELINSTGEKIY